MLVRVLGPFVAQTPSGRAPLAGRRPRDVLAVLVQRKGREVAPELLLELVWGDSASALATAAVHTVVARLRRGLGPDWVHTGVAGYCLGPGVRVDADDHETSLRAGRDLRAGGRTVEAVARYREALALWRGPTAYDGVTDDLVVADRFRLEDARATATEELASLLVDHGGAAGAEEALELASGLTHEFPLREAPSRIAMRGAYRLGRQGEALRAYAGLRRRLRDELGIDPTPQTQAVHAQILAQRDPVSVSVPAARRRHAGRLPTPATATVARDAELGKLRQWHDGGDRLITLVGPGGVGKSRLLHELGRHLPPERTAYVDLSGTSGASAQQIAQRISIEHQLMIPGDDPVAGLGAALERSRMTALVDEAEWSLEAAATVAGELLVHCPGVRLVVTSRIPLDVPGERQLKVAPLACPELGATGAAARAAPAVQLLEARLRDRAPDLPVRDDDGALLARLARQVDGLPLGLEVVAAHAGTRSLAELAELLDHPLDVSGPVSCADSRHRSLRDALLWSVERMPLRQRRALRRISIFSGSFRIEAAAAVIADADAEELMRSLARDALVQLDRRGPRMRFRLLRTVRDLALESLVEEGELDQSRRLHRQFYAGRWRGVAFHDEMLFEIADEYDDYLQALEECLAAGDGGGAADLSLALGWYWVFHEAAGAVPWMNRILESGLLAPVEQARVALFRRSLDAAFLAGPPGPSTSEIRDMLADDPEWQVLAALVDVFAAYVAGDVDSARRQAESLVASARAHAPHHLPEVLGTAAVMRSAAGMTDEALVAAEEAWRMIGAEPTVLNLAGVVAKVGLALVDAGRPRRALAILSDAIESVDRRLAAAASNSLLINAGWAALACDEPAVAAGWFDRVLQRGQGLVRGHLAEAVSGAAATLSELSVPGADLHVSASAELCRRHGMALCPWLVAQLDRVPVTAAAAPDFITTRDDELADPVIAALHPVAAAALAGSGQPLG